VGVGVGVIGELVAFALCVYSRGGSGVVGVYWCNWWSLCCVYDKGVEMVREGVGA
jgi:hypothetical protein